MRHCPSIERILGMPQPPQAVNYDTENLFGEIFERLESLYDGTGDAEMQDRLLQVLSDVQELQLRRECELDDRENWGQAWKQYARDSVPLQYRVQLQLEQAAAR